MFNFNNTQTQIFNNIANRLDQIATELLNMEISKGNITGNQAQMIKNTASQNYQNLASQLLQQYRDGRIPIEAARNAMSMLLNQIVNSMNQQNMGGFTDNSYGNQMIQMGGMNQNQMNMGGSSTFNFNETPTPVPVNYNENYNNNDTETSDVIDNDEDDIYIRYSKDNSCIPKMEIINTVDDDKLKKFNIDNINIGKLIRQYRNIDNSVQYNYFKCEYLVPEENNSRLIINMSRIFPSFIDKKKFIIDVVYPRMCLIPKSNYDLMKDNYKTVKGAFLSSGYDAAINKFIDSSHPFVSFFTKMIINDINLMLRAFVRTISDPMKIFQISELDDIGELLILNQTTGIKEFNIDDFDGVMLNMVSQIFHKYFGRKSKIMTIEDDLHQIICHPDVVIRNKDFTERSYWKKDDEAYINELKKFTLFAFPNRLIFSNLKPKIFHEIFPNNNTYIFDKPCNSLEFILQNEVFQNLAMSTDMYLIGNNGLQRYYLGKDFQNNYYIFSK